MGSTRNKTRKTNPAHNRRSRSQRLRRIREKCERELLIAAQSTVIKPVNNQMKRKRNDGDMHELHTFSEIIIPTTSDAIGSASEDGDLNPLSTPLLDSKISSYINCYSRMQVEKEDSYPDFQTPHVRDISANISPPVKAAVDTGFDKMAGKGYRYVDNKPKMLFIPEQLKQANE